MSEQNPGEQERSDEARQNESWHEVGNAFEQLGDSIAQALRAAWSDETNRRRAAEMQAGLERMIREVGDAIHDTANTPQGQALREDAVRAADTLVSAGEQAAQEARPHLVNALQQANEALQKMIRRMEARQPSEGGEEEKS